MTISNAYFYISNKVAAPIGKPIYLREEVIRKVIKQLADQPMLVLNMMNENKSIKDLANDIIEKLSR